MSERGMSMKRRLFGLRRERGAVIIIVAAFMTSAIALVTFVIDVGHWFEHKRHLQMQVDAGALAGGSAFANCAAGSSADRASVTSAANKAIATETRRYAGSNDYVAPAATPNLKLLNQQVNNQPNVAVALNSTKYP